MLVVIVDLFERLAAHVLGDVLPVADAMLFYRFQEEKLLIGPPVGAEKGVVEDVLENKVRKGKKRDKRRRTRMR